MARNLSRKYYFDRVGGVFGINQDLFSKFKVKVSILGVAS